MFQIANPTILPTQHNALKNSNSQARPSAIAQLPCQRERVPATFSNPRKSSQTPPFSFRNSFAKNLQLHVHLPTSLLISHLDTSITGVNLYENHKSLSFAYCSKHFPTVGEIREKKHPQPGLLGKEHRRRAGSNPTGFQLIDQRSLVFSSLAHATFTYITS